MTEVCGIIADLKREGEICITMPSFLCRCTFYPSKDWLSFNLLSVHKLNYESRVFNQSLITIIHKSNGQAAIRHIHFNNSVFNALFFKFNPFIYTFFINQCIKILVSILPFIIFNTSSPINSSPYLYIHALINRNHQNHQ